MNARGQAVALEGVSHHFGPARALDDVSLAIAPGELVALLGPSGCGKTTLLQIIAGFIRPTGGEVRLDGVRVDNVPAGRRRIGMVFQSYALFPHLSVAENVAYGLRARGTARARVRTKTAEMLALVKMDAFAARLPAQLSGGQQQRVALARALAIEPGIVLLDEPFSALDKNLRLDMQIEIKSLLASYGVTSILVTHDQEEALSMADRIVVLNRGRIEQIDTPDALYDRPASLFVNGFIGHANVLKATVSGPGRVRIAAGPDCAFTVPAGLAAGAPVLVTIRPENLRIVAPGGTGTLPATVRVTMPLGPADVIEATTATGEAIKIQTARAPRTRGLGRGAEIGLAIADPAAVGVFPSPSPEP